MNTVQRLVLVAISLSALIMLLYPPFHMQYPDGVVSNRGYHFLFNPPYRDAFREPKITAFVHAPTLLVQFLGLLIVGGSTWFLAGTGRVRRKDSPASGVRSEGPTLMGQKVEFDPSRVVAAQAAAETPRRGSALRITKRLGVTLLAFLGSGVFIAIWNEYVPATGLSGAVMATTAVGIVFGTWRWSASFK